MFFKTCMFAGQWYRATVATNPAVYARFVHAYIDILRKTQRVDVTGVELDRAMEELRKLHGCGYGDLVMLNAARYVFVEWPCTGLRQLLAFMHGLRDSSHPMRRFAFRASNVNLARALHQFVASGFAHWVKPEHSLWGHYYLDVSEASCEVRIHIHALLDQELFIELTRPIAAEARFFIETSSQ